MDNKIMEFDNPKIEEYKLHQNKSCISLNDINVNEIVVSNDDPFINKIIPVFHSLQRF